MPRLRHSALSMLFCLSALAAPCSAIAGESVFGYTYTADTMPKGEQELEVTLTQRWDKEIGTYNATDALFEYERGLTDKLQLSVYAQGMRIKSQNAFPLDTSGEEVYPLDIDLTRMAGYKTALKYNFLSPYKDPIGLSFVWEVAYWRYFPKVDGAKTKQFSFEPKVIVQKNFMDDQLIWSYNLALESEYRKFPEGGSENEFSINHNMGISYRFARNFYAGLEGRHHMDILNGEKNHNDFFLGPTVQYSSKKWYVNATYLRQLDGSKAYTGYDVDAAIYPSANSRYHLEEDTKNEFRIKFGYNLD